VNIDGAALPRSAWCSIVAPVRAAIDLPAADRRSVMRPASPVRWVRCALAVSISIVVASVIPAAADRPRRSIAACARFDQTDRGDDRVAFTIHNACSLPVDCSVAWRVVCAPDAKQRRASHAGNARLAIPEGTSGSAEASAAICGDDAWVIDAVVWSCQPNKD
jgi:hypothetical protein